jgi:hypothetical protein
MNLHNYVRITFNKIVFIILSKLCYNFPPKLDYQYKIDINNNNFNLFSFTLKTLELGDLKTLFLNFNHSKILSPLHFLSKTPPCHLFLFDSEGNLFKHYTFHIHKPNDETDNLAFEDFSISLMKDIFKHCLYETFKKNISAKNYKFWIHVSNKNIL